MDQSSERQRENRKRAKSWHKQAQDLISDLGLWPMKKEECENRIGCEKREKKQRNPFSLSLRLFLFQLRFYRKQQRDFFFPRAPSLHTDPFDQTSGKCDWSLSERVSGGERKEEEDRAVPPRAKKKKKKKARDGRKAFAGHPSSFLRPQKERKAPRFSAVCVFFLISLPERIERISVLMLCNVIGVDLRRGRGRV